MKLEIDYESIGDVRHASVLVLVNTKQEMEDLIMLLTAMSVSAGVSLDYEIKDEVKDESGEKT